MTKCNDFVTHILVEANNTFTCGSKPLYFEEQKKEFLKYNIFHIIIDDMPNSAIPLENEVYQRNQILKALKFLSPDPNDKVIISDVDEIPNADKVSIYNQQYGMTALWMNKYNYYLNLKEKGDPWDRARAMPYSYLLDKTPDEVRNSGYDNVTTNAGSHFSWLGGWDNVLEKLKTTHHQEYNTSEFIPKFKEFYERDEFFVDGKRMDLVEIDETFPEYIRNHKNDSLKHLIKQA